MYSDHDFVAAAVASNPVPHEILDLVGIGAVDALTAPILIKASPLIYISKAMPPFLLMYGSKFPAGGYSLILSDRWSQPRAR
jgi:hypothetical protein